MSDVSPVDEQAAKAITDQESSELIGYRQTDEQKLAMVEFVAAKLAAARPVPEDAGDERQRAEHAARCDVAVVTARTVGGEVRLQDSLRVRVLRGALTEARAVLETALDAETVELREFSEALLSIRAALDV